MEDASKRAERYRFRAEELRTISSPWLAEDAREMIESVAKDYERMAEYLQRRSNQNRA